MTLAANAATRHIVNASVIAALGPEGMLINISRAANIDEEALLAALETKTLGSAALDVFEGDEDSGEDALAWAFGALGVQDRARHLCTLYLSDLADVIRESIDERFEFVRYAESLASSQPSFDRLAQALQAPTTLLDDVLQELTVAVMQRHQPQVVLLTVPFPGTVYASFRIAQTIRQRYPQTMLVLGGGYVNTELRELREPRVFDYFDFVEL